MAEALNADSIVAACTDQVSGDLPDGEFVILHVPQGVYYGLNAVGGRIWQLIQTPRPVGEIEAMLQEEYEVDAERCQQEVRALLQDLVARGLAEVRDPQVG